MVKKDKSRIAWRAGVGREKFIKKEEVALAGVVQWTECWPVNRKVIGLIPGQGTCLGCGPGPQLRCDLTH